jgi:HlyD family secretion protein
MRQDRFLGTHRLLIAALAAAFFAFLAWAFLAEIDIVATAQGKLAPVTFVRVAQPVEGGVVRAIKVHDGESVAAGTALIELDPLFANEDAKSSALQTDRLKLQLQRIDAELAGVPFLPQEGSEALRAAALSEYTLRRQAVASALAEAEAALDKATSDARTADERLDRARQMLPLVAKQSDMQRDLQERGFVSNTAAIDKFKELVDAKQELATQLAAGQSARAAVAQARSTIERVKADYRRQLATERAQALADLGTADGESAKREHRLRQTTLVAPVAGTVNGLASLSVGQVVSTGASLLTIVPKGERLRMEGWVRNEDAAFVSPGMPAKVKVAAYPFQKYGWVEAEVAWLGVDAETPESMKNAQGEPLFYRVRFELKRQALSRDGKPYELRPGMQVIGDIQIGKRTLVEYLTSPVRQVLLEAAREK